MCENNVLSTCKCATGQTKTVDAITVGPMGTPSGVMIGPHQITEVCMSCKSKTKIFLNKQHFSDLLHQFYTVMKVHQEKNHKFVTFLKSVFRKSFCAEVLSKSF